MTELAKRLREYRAGLGITQKEMAQQIGISSASLSAYENGTKMPPLEIAIKIADTLDVALDWLCGRDIGKGTNEIKTYADIAKSLVRAIDADAQMWRFQYDANHIGELSGTLHALTNDEILDNGDGKVSLTTFISPDVVMSDFLKGWTQIRTLYLKRIINREMYEAWLEKKYKDLSSYSIQDGYDFFERSDWDMWDEFEKNACP